MGGSSSKGASSPFPLSNFQESLLTPPDDDSVRQTWSILRSAIDSHARRFYHTDSVYQSRDRIREAVHDADIVEDAQEAEDLATLLHSPRHRRMGLRICIARVIVASIDFCGHPDDTSLDPAVVELLRKFEHLRPDLCKEEEAALAGWRMITAFFLQPGAQARHAAPKPCVATLEELLAVFARSDSDSERELRLAGLAAVAARAVELGEKFFCHAARWRFEWRPPADELAEKPPDPSRLRRRSIVIFPALMRTDDEGLKMRDGLSYTVIRRKAVSGASFFDVRPSREASTNSTNSSSSSSSSSSSEGETEDVEVENMVPPRSRGKKSSYLDTIYSSYLPPDSLRSLYHRVRHKYRNRSSMWFTVELVKVGHASYLDSEDVRARLERAQCNGCGKVVVREYGFKWAIHGYVLRVLVVEAPV